MSSIARIASIACLLGTALAQYESCTLENTVELLNLTDEIPCQRAGDGVWAYEDEYGGCCLTLDVEQCTADPSCGFLSILGVCGWCMSIEQFNSEQNFTATDCQDASAQLEAHPIFGVFFNFQCDASVTMDCCTVETFPEPEFNTTNNCSMYDAETCVADGPDSECAIFYISTVDCYTCSYAGGVGCANFQTYFGVGNPDNTTSVYCDTTNVRNAPMCGYSCFDYTVCGMQLAACTNNTDCAYVIYNIDDTGDYGDMANAAQDLCTQDGYTCTDELDALTTCMMDMCDYTLTTEPAATDAEPTDAVEETTDVDDMATTTSQPSTTEDDGTSSASRVYVLVAMLVSVTMMMIAF